MGDRVNKAGENWGAIRKRLREAVKNQCALCGDYCAPDILEVDHIKPLSLGGNDEDENLRVLCHPCHVERHSLDREFILEEQKIIKLEARRARARKYMEIRQVIKRKVPKESFNREYTPFRFGIADLVKKSFGS